MQFISEEEYKERYKKKLWLWGSYTREKEAAERRLHEIEDELRWNADFPKNAARNCHVRSIDNKHTEVEQLQLDCASLPHIIDDIVQERSYLGLDEFIAGLQPADRELIKQVFTQRIPYRDIEMMLPRSKSNVGYRINQLILKTWDTSH